MVRMTQVDLILKMMCCGEVSVMDTRGFEEAKYVGLHVKLVDSGVQMKWDGVRWHALERMQ
jgi:hypothetical protein